MSILTPRTYTGPKDGPHVLITGGVHGNEHCGPAAISSVQGNLNRGELHLERGRLTLIQTCNPQAYANNRRYYERDLNRALFPKDDPQTYEDHIANELCPLLAEANYLLDLHSNRSGKLPFAFISPDQTPEELMLLDHCGVSHALFGFAESYKAANIDVDARQGMGTREYHLLNGGTGLTLECGRHQDEASIQTGYRAILDLLSGLEMLELPDFWAAFTAPPFPRETKVIQIIQPIFKERPGLLTQEWENLTFVAEDTLIARYDDGEEIKSPHDALIIMPDARPDMPIGEEWYYLGIEV